MGRPSRRLALAGIVGPAVFVADWAILGAVASHYTPTRDTISRLAETGVATRPAMTAGFVVYGAALPLFAVASGSRLPRGARALVAVTGISTLGVAAFPVGTQPSGHVHAVFAGLGYVTLAAAPLVHARSLARRGRGVRAAAVGSLGVACGVLLVTSVAVARTGLLQRAGLTLGDGWIVANALAAWRSPDRAWNSSS